MRLNHLKDQELLMNAKKIAQDERHTLTKMLHHLAEIERRKLFCDLHYGSLFEYAVHELKYSEGQASRRINAMRLIREIPQVESAIARGELNLTNVSQAQTVFKNIAKESPERTLPKTEKIVILNSLKNKSAREGQAELLKVQPKLALPKEKERLLTENQSQVSFVMSDALKEKLEKVRTVLGAKGADLSYAELFNEMAELSISSLESKKFGKKRSEAARKSESAKSTPASQAKLHCAPRISGNNRYIGQALVQKVWRTYHCACANCGARKNLQIDHIVPLALEGKTQINNLRLLCFNCNQHAAMKSFGVEYILERQRSGTNASTGR